MPKTPFTEYCSCMHHLVQRLHDFIAYAVIPTIDAQAHARPEVGRKRDNAIQVTFIRIVRWLKTVDRLDQTHDVQAVGAAARSVFELHMDLKWFEKYPDPKYLERFCAFSDVAMYLAAKKVVEHKRQNPGSRVNSTPHEAFMNRADAEEPMRDKVGRLWGADPETGRPCWPRDHWAGEGKLPKRTQLLGLDCQDAYVEIYSILCALVHAGPSPEVRRSLSDFEWLEKQMGYAYFQLFLHARAAAVLVCDLLNARPYVEGFDVGIQQLDEWLNEAQRTLPKAS